MQIPMKDGDTGVDSQYQNRQINQLEALANYLQWYDLRVQCSKLIVSKLVHIIPISGDLIILTEQEKEKSECPWKGLVPSSQEVIPCTLVPYFKEQNNDRLLIPIQNAEVYNGKRINIWRRRRDGGDKLEERTDFSDAFDTLYIGCQRFPQETVVLPVTSDI